MRFSSVALLCLALGSIPAVRTSAQAAAPVVTPIECPAGSNSMGSSLFTARDGAVWLSWVETDATKIHSLKCARFDATRSAWGEVRVVASGRDWFVNWADFPTLCADGDHLTAVWFVQAAEAAGHHESYSALYSQSADGGRNWSTPVPLTRESASVEFATLQPLPDGRVLAAWLDGRGRHDSKADRQALYARVLGDEKDQLVDPSVCDCCQLSLVATPEGGATLAYRGRTDDEVRDMQFSTYRDGRWTPPALLHADGWEIAACPVNGPQLSTNGKSVGAVWFTSPEGRSRVYASTSPGELAPVTQPVTIDLGKPLGRVENVMLADGRQAIFWLDRSGVEKPGGLYLRVLDAKGESPAPTLIAPMSVTRSSGFPRAALLREGSRERVLLAYTQAGENTRVATVLISLD